MQLKIYFNPAELSFVPLVVDDIYIVIDVMRATTTMAVMFDQGARQVLAAQTLEQALDAGQQIPGRLLCGERHTKTPPGFDYGNSPAQFSQLDLSERELILTTSNGTRALFACPQKSTILAGSFYNARAVTTHALALAKERGSNIAVVCAAEYGYFSLEDTACAGYLALELLRQQPHLAIDDSTYGAITICESYPPALLIERAQSARDLIAAGLQQDLDFCLKQNSSTSVPLVEGVEPQTGLLKLHQAVSLAIKI